MILHSLAEMSDIGGPITQQKKAKTERADLDFRERQDPSSEILRHFVPPPDIVAMAKPQTPAHLAVETHVWKP